MDEVDQQEYIIDLLATDKSRYLAITEFENCFFIRSPSLFVRSDLSFSRKTDRKKEKSVVSFTHKENIICSQTQLRISRPLFVGSYLQVTWWASGQWKGRTICIEWCYAFFCIFIFSFAKLKEQEEAEKELMADERETALKNMREKFSSDMEEEKKKLAEEQKEALEELREKLEKEKESVSHF